MAHRLDPLFRPRRIALVGVSTRPGSVGQVMVQQLSHGGFKGEVFGVNPKGGVIAGLTCARQISDLPRDIDLYVLALGDHLVEEAFEAAIAQGAKAAIIFSNLTPKDDPDQTLRARIQDKARAAGVILHGAMCMGFYDFTNGTWICGFPTRADHRAGGITLITQSGSVLPALVDCEGRIDFNLVISSGLEQQLNIADYLDYALDQPETRAIGLFLETARDPKAFHNALARAAQMKVPVVALKVGRSQASARLAISHSGALVGNDAAYEALFRRFGVSQVRSLEEMATSLLLYANCWPLGPGGLVSIHDSGGERGLLLDMAEDEGVPFAQLSQQTQAQLESRLDPGLPAVNPLDAWNTGTDYRGVFSDCMVAMMKDPDAAIGAVVGDRGPGGKIFDEYAAFANRARQESSKPVALLANNQGSGHDPRINDWSAQGLAVIDSPLLFLKAVRHLFDRRAFEAQKAETRKPEAESPTPSMDLVPWRQRLGAGEILNEAASLDLLEVMGVPTVPRRTAANEEELIAAARALGFPLALKTAAPELAHKSEAEGVILNLRDEASLRAAYHDLSQRLGPTVLLQAMAQTGIELIFGAVHDPDFGALVTIGLGGLFVEVYKDCAQALAPVSPQEARRMIDSLQGIALLNGVRGRAPVDLDTLAEVFARFSVGVADLGAALAEMDVNPLIATPHGLVAVDGLVRGGAGEILNPARNNQKRSAA